VSDFTRIRDFSQKVGRTEKDLDEAKREVKSE
jgi:hypothetical protein